MKATCLITLTFAFFIFSTASRKPSKLYNVLTELEKIEPVLEERFGNEVDEDFNILRRKNIEGNELVDFAKEILEGTITDEKIGLCQLVKNARKKVFGNLTQYDNEMEMVNKLSVASRSKESVIMMDILRDIGKGLKQAAICKACVISVNLILLARRTSKLDKETILRMFHLLCRTLGKSLIGGKSCFGLVEMNMDSVLYIADNRQYLGTKMCGIVLQNYGCSIKEPENWSIKIDNGIPLDSKKKRDPSIEPYKVLHITDIHYDPYYAPNVSTNCNEVMLCCQEHDEKTETEDEKSGFWTDYRTCDIPARFVDEALNTIKEDQKHITHIYFTGDVISHRAWNIDSSTNIYDLKLIMDMFKTYFPEATIYPILGNHEPHPLNLYPPSELQNSQFSVQTLFNEVADIWKHFLPRGTDLSTIRKGGYYTVKENGQPRIIALNSNVGYTLNYWLIYKDYDYYDQLQWLADTLHEAEKAGETVHILTHVPSGSSDSYVGWSREFQKIIERYYHIIAGIFSGHTHIDELYVYYKNGSPINMGFNGGSLTPYVDVNPNYKMLTVTSDTHEIMDIEEYYINVTEANIEKTIKWHKLYSFKNEYNLNEINPTNLHGLVMKMATNSSLREIYRKNSFRLGPAIYETCDKNCHQQNLCNIVTNVFGEQMMCNKLKRTYKN